MKRGLVDIVGRESAEVLAGMSGYLEAEAVQNETAGGLVVAVGLVNDGDDEVRLLNPFALVQFQVRDRQGFPLAVPNRPPPMLIHNAGGEDWSLDGPVPIVGVRRNGQPADLHSIEGRVVRFAGREDCRVSFEIARFLTGSTPAGEADEPATPAEVAIPDGAYSVSVVVTLIEADQATASRLLQSDEIQVRFAARSREPRQGSSPARIYRV